MMNLMICNLYLTSVMVNFRRMINIGFIQITLMSNWLSLKYNYAAENFSKNRVM